MLFAPKIAPTQIDMNLDEYQPFEDKRYSLTNYIESLQLLLFCPCLGWQATTLDMLDQEVIFKKSNLCGVTTQKRPYAQLGSVDKIQSNMCCFAISSDFAPVGEDGKGGVIPQWGCCNADFVDEVVKNLQERKEKRGSIAQIKKLEVMQGKIISLAVQLPLLLDKYGIQYKPDVLPLADPFVKFQTKKFDVSNNIEAMCCTVKQLILEPEEAQLTTNGCFGMQSVTTKREYAQLGHVEKKKACCCCSIVTSDLGILNPGWGCNHSMVADLVTELRDRMAMRGDVGQIKKQEVLLKQWAEISKEMALLNQKEGDSYPPNQQFMRDVLKADDLEMPTKTAAERVVEESQQVEPKEYDITNKCEALSACIGTCGVAGWTTTKLELTDNEVNIITKNNIDDSNLKMNYAQLESVDVTKVCGCCYRVNFADPGWGCSKSLVEELAGELQQRKVKRGNIAQIRQLEVMEAASVETDVRLSMHMQKQGIQYPPSQDHMTSKYGEVGPRLNRVQQMKPHITPVAKFDTKKYDLTNYLDCCCSVIWCCGPKRTKMELGPEEMYLSNENWCVKTNSRVPYAQLGSVDVETMCCCCIGLPEIATPGLGFSHAVVKEVAEELQNRKVRRGNIAQLKMQENLIDELLRTSVKVDLIMDKAGVAFPPSTPEMIRIFGSDMAPKGSE